MKLWDLGKRRPTSNISSSEQDEAMDRRLAQNCFNLSISENISRSFSRLRLFIFAFDSWESYRVHVGPTTKSQKRHKIIWQIGSQCHCISRKIPLLELNLRQYNSTGKDLLYNFCFGFWNKPLVWNNCCQIACICTDSYSKDLFQDGKLFATNHWHPHCTIAW